jgi:hypothetical protein
MAGRSDDGVAQPGAAGLPAPHARRRCADRERLSGRHQYPRQQLRETGLTDHPIILPEEALLIDATSRVRQDAPDFQRCPSAQVKSPGLPSCRQLGLVAALLDRQEASRAFLLAKSDWTSGTFGALLCVGPGAGSYELPAEPSHPAGRQADCGVVAVTAHIASHLGGTHDQEKVDQTHASTCQHPGTGRERESSGERRAGGVPADPRG